MGERKVLNKYYPHDFDPSKIPRRRRSENQQIKVRMMLPMTLRCAACGQYLGRGTKFNARKEDAAGERYLGAIQVFRFYVRCTRCSAEIVFKTDPRNAGYAVESGAALGRKPCWRDGDGGGGAAPKEENAMARLEARARDGRREMDADAALEEARSLSARRARVAPEQLLESLRRRGNAAADGERATLHEPEQEDDDEALVRSISFRSSAGYVKRIEDDDDDQGFFEACLAKTVTGASPSSHQAVQEKQPQKRAADRAMVVVSKRRCGVVPTTVTAESKAADDGRAETSSEGKASAGETKKAGSSALQVLCCTYDDSSDGDDNDQS